MREDVEERVGVEGDGARTERHAGRVMQRRGVGAPGSMKGSLKAAHRGEGMRDQTEASCRPTRHRRTPPAPPPVPADQLAAARSPTTSTSSRSRAARQT